MTTCVVCGCDDDHACVAADGARCSWAQLDVHGVMGDPHEFGICSGCDGVDAGIGDDMERIEEQPQSEDAPRLILPGDDGYFL